MNARALLIAGLFATAAIAFSGPVADHAGVEMLEPVSAAPDDPQCLQIYPWSTLCEDGPVAFYCEFFQPQGVFAEPCTL